MWHVGKKSNFYPSIMDTKYNKNIYFVIVLSSEFYKINTFVLEEMSTLWYRGYYIIISKDYMFIMNFIVKVIKRTRNNFIFSKQCQHQQQLAEINIMGWLRTKLYEKRDNFNFLLWTFYL